MDTRKYTLITGASCGLGKEFAIDCARRGRNLILTALPGELVSKTGRQLARQYNVDVVAYEADLTNIEEVRALAGIINDNYNVDMLINNAGLGGAHPFIESAPEYIEKIILLNIYAVVMITRFLLPNLKKQGESYILNIASLAAFRPMPFKTVYPASKAFVYSFSRSLDAELKGTGVSVSVAHPGGMKTNAEVSQRINNHPKWIQSTTLSAEKVAHICIRRMLRRRKVIIPGIVNKLYWLLLKITPLPITLYYLHALFGNEYKKRNQKVEAPQLISN